MSSVKYDEVACENVATNLESINSLLSEVSSELERLVGALPTRDRIDNRIIKLSTKTRTNEDGTTEDYIDYDTKRYYENNYRAPLLTAKTNITTTKSNVTSLNKSVTDIDDKVRAIQKLVVEYEEKPVEKQEIDGLAGGTVTSTTPLVPPTQVADKTGIGQTELNKDTDGDGKPDLNIDVNGDGKADLNIDTDNDGKPDLNIDVNGDGKADLNIDVDNDGKPDYNIDTNGDGKADLNVDTDGDGKPDLNVDLDGNGTADLNIDKDGDGKPDLNVDIDGDGKADLNIDTDGDGKADKNIDADGDGKVDPITSTTKPEDTNPEDGDGKTEGVPTTPPNKDSDVFDDDKADDTEDGFADNIVAGVNGEDTKPEDGSGATGSNGGAGGIWGPGANGEGSGEGGAFPFLPGGSTSSDGENPDFIYRGLYDQSGDSDVDISKIKYNAIGDGESSVAKGAAIAGAVGLGVSGVDAVATMNEARKDAIDGVASEEKEEKKLVKTIVSSSILGLVSIGYIITLLMPKPSILAIILLGVAMAISSITATSGLKIGKYIGFGATLFVSLLTFILASCGVVTPIGYVVVYATFVILSIAAFLLDLMKGMFDDKIELLPIVIAIAVGLFFGMLKVLNVINWIVFIILLLVTVGGYFLWDKVIKYKLPDDDDDEVVDNVIYKPVQYTENSPMNAPEQEKFDPRSLYQEDDANNQAMLNNMANNQNPFANYNPQNSTFNNAFNDDNNNNNGNGMF